MFRLENGILVTKETGTRILHLAYCDHTSVKPHGFTNRHIPPPGRRLTDDQSKGTGVILAMLLLRMPTPTEDDHGTILRPEES
jgi:hypothetical protein